MVRKDTREIFHKNSTMSLAYMDKNLLSVPHRILEQSSSGEISHEFRGEMDSKLQQKRKKVKTKN